MLFHEWRGGGQRCQQKAQWFWLLEETNYPGRWVAELLINMKTVPDYCEESGKIVRGIVTVRSVSKVMILQLWWLVFLEQRQVPGLSEILCVETRSWVWQVAVVVRNASSSHYRHRCTILHLGESGWKRNYSPFQRAEEGKTTTSLGQI